MSLPTWEEQAAAHVKTYGEEPPAAVREFLELANYFEYYKGTIVSFEVLPSILKPEDGSPLLVDGPAVAIGKKDLVKAFVYARSVFFGQAADAYGRARSGQVHGPEKESAARIMLLFDPEHLTASNHLKKRLLSVWKESPEAVSHHLTFLTSVLTSPLNKHSKSPNLWYHRFWLVKTFRYWDTLPSAHANIRRGKHTSYKRAQFSHDERIVVLKAADQHPKNYHAFQYLRRLWTLMWSKEWIREWHLRGDAAAGDLIKRMHTWCQRNPTDISGWTFLVWICCQPNPTRHLAKTKAYYMASCVDSWRKKVCWNGASVDWFIKSMEMLGPTYFPRASACTVGARRAASPISKERMAIRRGLIDAPASERGIDDNDEPAPAEPAQEPFEEFATSAPT